MTIILGFFLTLHLPSVYVAKQWIIRDPRIYFVRHAICI